MCEMSNLLSIGPGSLSNLTNLEELFVAGNPRLTRVDEAAIATADEFGTLHLWPHIRKVNIRYLISIGVHVVGFSCT